LAESASGILTGEMKIFLSFGISDDDKKYKQIKNTDFMKGIILQFSDYALQN